MATLGNLVVNLSANSQRLNKGLSNAQKRLSNFSKQARASVTSVVGIASKIGGAIGGGGLGFGVKLAADAESAQVAFATLLGSAEAAKKALSDLQGFAASTPFELGDLRDASKLLLNSGVSTDQLIGRMTMLGDIAAGTGKPIGEFASIYSKVGSTGKVSLETLNQLAERGVPIYGALAKQLGVNREQMLKMIGSGKVGFADLHNSMAGMTTEGGVFAGGMKAQSTPLAGLFSTMKDNIGFALQAIAEQLIEAFDFKGIMGKVISFSQTVTQYIKGNADVFKSMADGIISFASGAGSMLVDVFSATWTHIENIASTMGEWFAMLVNGVAQMMGFSSSINYASELFGTFGKTVETVSSFVVDAFRVVRQGIETALAASIGFGIFMFDSFAAQAKTAAYAIGLYFVTNFEIMKHFLTVVLPTAASWLWDNIGNLFRDGVNFAMTVFSNLTTNIKNAWTALWAWIKGDSNTFDFEWKGLTDGFIAETKKLPQIAEREASALEKKLSRGMTTNAKAVGDSWDRNVTQPLAELRKQHEKEWMPAVPTAPEVPEAPKAPEAPGAAAGPDMITGGGGGGATTSSGSSKSLAGIARRGSTEAFSQIVSAMQRGKSPAEKLQKEANKELKEIAKNTQPREKDGGVMLISAGAV